MPETFTELPDGQRLAVYSTEHHPDISGLVNFQIFLLADVPSYVITADNVSSSNNTNILSVFNNISTGERVRVQEISAYPKATANNVVVLQAGYINSIPSGGTDADFTRLAADYPPNQSPPNGVISKVLPTSPNPIAGVIFGGNILNLNSSNPLQRVTIYKKDANKSSIHLRAGQDGIMVRQVAGGNTGSYAVEVCFIIG